MNSNLFNSLINLYNNKDYKIAKIIITKELKKKEMI